jgi:transcriptional regulator with XRE-family HTH domain
LKILLSQSELARQLDTHHFIIGKYERDEMQPSIEAAKKIAKLVGITVGYLLGETDEENILKDPEMVKRLNEIEKMDSEDKGSILKVLDGFIKSVKLKNIAAL